MTKITAQKRRKIIITARLIGRREITNYNIQVPNNKIQITGAAYLGLFEICILGLNLKFNNHS
jgi:hypothetical protein